MTFKQYLQEFTHKKIIDHMIDTNIPLTKTVLKNLGFETKNMQAFHATELKHLKNIQKIAKSKKTLSTFSKGLPSVLQNILTKPDVIVKLEGTAVLDYDSDIFSTPDQNGRRWLSTFSLPVRKYEFLFDALTRKLAEEMNILINDIEEVPTKTADVKDYLKVNWQNLSGKQKQYLIQYYLKKVESLTSNNIYQKIIHEMLEKHNKESNNYSHNEILMNQSKIIGVYALQNGRFQYKSKSEEEFIGFEIKQYCNCPYLGFIEKDKFSKVTPQTY